MATITKWLLTLCLLLSLVGCNKKPHIPDEEVDTNSYRLITYNGVDYKYNSHLVNFLVLGTDTYEDTIGQSDFIGLLIFDRQNEKISIFTLSRDAYVPIKTYGVGGEFIDWSSNHLALAYSYGRDRKEASYLSADAVSRLLNNIPMSYVSSFDLNSIYNIHSVVGSVDVVIPDDSLVFANPSWKKGKKLTITSDNVEAFVRMRDVKENFTNTNRMARQRTYLLAFSEKLKTLLNENFEETAMNLESVMGDCFTNFDLSEIEAFAKMMMEYEFGEDSFYTLPGGDEQGALHDRFIVDEEALLELLIELFYVEI